MATRYAHINIIAEDLGDVTEDVINLRDSFNFPGMRVLQFEMDKIPFHDDFSKNSIVCTGTHDNDTLRGWFESLPDHSKDKLILTKKKLLNFFNCNEENIHWKIIDFAFKRFVGAPNERNYLTTFNRKI